MGRGLQNQVRLPNYDFTIVDIVKHIQLHRYVKIKKWCLVKQKYIQICKRAIFFNYLQLKFIGLTYIFYITYININIIYYVIQLNLNLNNNKAQSYRTL